MITSLFPWQEIDLVEALCGFQKTVEMLDKRHLLITSHPGELIKPGKCLVFQLFTSNSAKDNL